MGIFDFMRDAGRKVGIDEAAADEKLDELRESNKLLRFILDTGLDIEHPKVTYDDGIATVSGTAPSQAVRENAILALGNCAGVRRVVDHIDVDEPEPEFRFYTVQKGDSLSKISKELLGSASRYPEIFEANQPLLEDPDKIYPGQVLRIPPA